MGQSLGDLVITLSATLDPLKKGLGTAASLVTQFGRDTNRSLVSTFVDPLKGLTKGALSTALGLGLAGGMHGLADTTRDVVTESVRVNSLEAK